MTLPINPESIDLAELAAVLRACCGLELRGLLVGKTQIRDEVVRHLSCSELEAETLVDTMVGRGFVVRHDGTDGTSWRITGSSASR
ncbi:MAG: hypothetical protein ABI488_27235 [Polyangiaceae bacterium]